MLLKNFVDNPGLLSRYSEWRNHPTTQLMLDFARSMAEPIGLPSPNRTGEGALYYAGRVDGAYDIYNMLSNLPAFVEMQVATARAQGLLKETTYEQPKETDHARSIN